MSDNGNEPKAREVLLRATSRAGLQENDPLYAVVMAQAELFENAMSGHVPHAEDIEAARAEILALTQTVRAIGEGTAKMERRFTIIGDSLSKIEDRLKGLNEVTNTFAGVARHQLWLLVGGAIAAGIAFTFAAEFLASWLSGVLHI